MKGLTFLLIIVFCFTSCQRIIEQNQFNTELNNYTSPYQGTWYGVYNGAENGQLQIMVYKAGNIEVKRTFNNTAETFYGQVYDNGVINDSYSNSGFLLSGSLNTKSGVWKQGSLNGSWTVTKQ